MTVPLIGSCTLTQPLRSPEFPGAVVSGWMGQLLMLIIDTDALYGGSVAVRSRPGILLPSPPLPRPPPARPCLNLHKKQEFGSVTLMLHRGSCNIFTPVSHSQLPCHDPGLVWESSPDSRHVPRPLINMHYFLEIRYNQTPSADRYHFLHISRPRSIFVSERVCLASVGVQVYTHMVLICL